MLRRNQKTYMKKRSTHSHLQNRILLYIGSQTVNSLTEMAQELKAHRSSVSRAMHALLATNLVSKTNDGWALTSEGKEELQRIQHELPERTAKTVVSANRLIEQGRLAALSSSVSDLNPTRSFTEASDMLQATLRIAQEDSQRSLLLAKAASEVIQPFASIFDLAKSFTAISESAELNFVRAAREAAQSLTVDFALGAPAQEFQKAFGEATAMLHSEASTFSAINAAKLAAELELMKSFSAKPTLTEITARQMFDIVGNKPQSVIAEISSRLAQEALISFSESQRLSSFSIEQVASLGKIALPAVKELTQVNLGIGEIIRDLGTISARDFAFQADFSSIVTQMMPNVAEVARTYRGYLADAVGNLGDNLGNHQRINWSLGLPTGTTSAYINTVKVAAIIDAPDVEGTDLLETTRTFWEERPAQLNNAFQDLGPNYVAMWQGSWIVLKSDSPDRIRQAAHSGRELLMQLLAELAPDSAFNEKEIEQHGHNGKVTRKMRVMKILEGGSTSTITWADAVVKVLEETYNCLAAVSHNRSAYQQFTEQQIAGLLYSLGGLLAFIQGFRRQ